MGRKQWRIKEKSDRKKITAHFFQISSFSAVNPLGLRIKSTNSSMSKKQTQIR